MTGNALKLHLQDTGTSPLSTGPEGDLAHHVENAAPRVNSESTASSRLLVLSHRLGDDLHLCIGQRRHKAVVYQHASLQGGFWSGRAIDRQLNSLSGEPSNYWISDFLQSDFTTTPAWAPADLQLLSAIQLKSPPC